MASELQYSTHCGYITVRALVIYLPELPLRLRSMTQSTGPIVHGSCEPLAKSEAESNPAS